MSDQNIIISTRSDGKIGTRELMAYIFGLCAGIFLLVYPGRILYKIFGVAILLAEVVIYLRAAAERKSFVEVCEKEVRGLGFTDSSNKLTEFSARYGQVKNAYSSDNLIVIETKSGTYKCRAGDRGTQVSLEISRRMKKHGE